MGTANSGGYNRHDIRGTYALANLLQELTIAQDYGRRHIILDEARLTENPVARLHRLIKTSFWDGLTRRIDGSVIELVTKDPKAERMEDPRPRIYVPKRAPEQLDYYRNVARQYPELNLDVVQLPETIDAAYTKSSVSSACSARLQTNFSRHQRQARPPGARDGEVRQRERHGGAQRMALCGPRRPIQRALW